MSNVITFKKPSPSQNVEDFVSWLHLLKDRAGSAHKRVSSARSTDKVLAYYAEWLRRYWEMNGAVRSLWTHLEEHIRVHGREIDVDRTDDILDFMAAVEATVKGPHPWLALPSFPRTKAAAIRLLEEVGDNLTWAIAKAEAIGRSTHDPDERTPA
jgi:hypothetical protein